MAEGARLESVFTGNRNVGSNPTPSAKTLTAPPFLPPLVARFFEVAFGGKADMLYCSARVCF